MNLVKEYSISGWKDYVTGIKKFLGDKNFNYIDGSVDDENFIIVMDREDLKTYVPELVESFKDKNLTVSCVMIHGSSSTSDPPGNVHIDQIPLMDTFYYSPFAINLPVQNVEDTYLVYYEIIDPLFEFDEDKPFTEKEVKEICRVNYNRPLVLRIDKYHAVCNTHKKCRITASIRFVESIENLL